MQIIFAVTENETILRSESMSEIISRIALGLFVLTWITSHFVYTKTGKLAEMFAALTCAMIMVGFVECILTVIGF